MFSPPQKKKKKRLVCFELNSHALGILVSELYYIVYLVRKFLLQIEKYMFHISKNPEVQSRLSEQEKGFARRCADDMERHLEESVLSKLPDNYQDIVKQSIISEESDMIPEPQLDSFVVCKSRRFLGPFQLDGSDELLEMKPDELCIIHYKSIRERVQEGDIDLV